MKITFPVVAPGIRRNAETGIEIRTERVRGKFGTETKYRVYRDSGPMSYWRTGQTLRDAKELAIERVEMVREEGRQ